MPNNVIIKDILLSEIEYDEIYKVSSNIIDNRLEESVRHNGVLTPVILLDNKASKYIIIAGHNRYKLADKYNIKSIKALVLPVIDYSILKQLYQEKDYIGSFTTIGRIKAYKILCNLPENTSYNEFKEVLSLPDFIIRDELILKKIENLPGYFVDYLEERKISFKIIKKLLALDSDVLKVLCLLIKKVKFKMNYLKDIIQYIEEINNRDNSLEKVCEIDFKSDDAVANEVMYYNEIKKIRYPEFVKNKSMVDSIKNKIKIPGVKIDFPEYFEGGSFNLVMNFSKTRNIELFEKLVSEENKANIKKLVELL